jgi:hypothetical protein
MEYGTLGIFKALFKSLGEDFEWSGKWKTDHPSLRTEVRHLSIIFLKADSGQERPHGERKKTSSKVQRTFI